MRQNIIDIYDTTILLHFLFLFLNFFPFSLSSFTFYLLYFSPSLPTTSILHALYHTSLLIDNQPSTPSSSFSLAHTHTRDLYNRRVLTGDDRPTSFSASLTHFSPATTLTTSTSTSFSRCWSNCRCLNSKWDMEFLSRRNSTVFNKTVVVWVRELWGRRKR